MLADLTTLNSDPRTAVITLNRPEDRNALNASLVQQLSQHLDWVQDSEVQRLVITGAGRDFCAGGDLAVVASTLDAGDPAGVQELAALVGAVVRQLRSLNALTVALLDGNVVGAGVGLAMATDLRVCTSRTRFIAGFAAVGTVPDAGVSALMSRALGPSQFLSWLATNELLNGVQLCELGLADRCVSDDADALAETLQFLANLTPVSPLALREARALIDNPASSLSEQIDREYEALGRMRESSDYREGARSFLGRRPPEFTGR